ncbi:hypothetical protein AAIH46_17825 [Rhizobium sp. 0TCS1.26]|uniref:hypothetical protein n=1 Tax=Rhizobium sp. 0TCS1.26 TaxID=3142623 RepID=UPI003D26F4A0
MKKDEPADLPARIKNAQDTSRGALWPTVLSNVVVDLKAKQEVVTNTEVAAELRRIAEDEGADRLMRDGAAEALQQLSGKLEPVKSP